MYIIYIYICIYISFYLCETQEGVDFPRLQNEESCNTMMNAILMSGHCITHVLANFWDVVSGFN